MGQRGSEPNARSVCRKNATVRTASPDPSLRKQRLLRMTISALCWLDGKGVRLVTLEADVEALLFKVVAFVNVLFAAQLIAEP